MPIYVNGQYIVKPQAVVVVDDSAMSGTAVSGPVLALIGSSISGVPKTAISIRDYKDAQNKLRGSSLLQGCQRAFKQSTPQVIAVRVDPSTQSTFSLKDASNAAVATLTSVDYGTWTTQTKVLVTNGSTSGYKASVGNDYDGKPVVTKDNIGYDIFSIVYSGTNTNPNITIDGTTLTLKSTQGTEQTDGTITLTGMTAQQLVNQINGLGKGYTTTLLAQNPNFVVAGTLDYVTAVAVPISPAATLNVTANLQALVDWFNSGAQPYVTAARAADSTTMIVASMSGFAYLTGGTDGTATNSDWQDVYTYLQTQNVAHVVPLTSSPAIWAMNDAHLQYMASQGSPRTGSVGDDKGKALSDQISNVLTLNSDRTVLVWPGIKDYDISGNLTVLPPYMAAAQFGGMLVSGQTQNALTGQTVSALDLEYTPSPSEIDTGLQSGICLLVKTFKSTIEISRSQTTWLQTASFLRREISTRRIADVFSAELQDALNTQLRGLAGSPATLPLAVSIANSIGARYAAVGWIVGDDANPAYKNFTASLSGDTVTISGQISPAIPVNYIPVYLAAVPYSGVA